MNTTPSKTSTLTIVVVAAALAGALLSGCSAQPEFDSPARPVQSAPATTPTPVDQVEETSAPAQLVPGAVVTVDQREAAEAQGFGVYETSDGTLTVIDVHADLPAHLLEDWIAAVGQVGPPAPKSPGTEEIQAAIFYDWKVQNSGKKIVMIAEGGNYGVDGTLESTTIRIATSSHEIAQGGFEFDTAEEAYATAEARIAAQPEPTIYQLIDLTE